MPNAITNETGREIFDHLFSLLETLDTQSAAMLQLVRDKHLASEKEIASYMEQASQASSVRWRAARVRIEYLLTPAKPADPTDNIPKAQNSAEAAPPTSTEKPASQQQKTSEHPEKEQTPAKRPTDTAEETLGRQTEQWDGTRKDAPPEQTKAAAPKSEEISKP